VVWLQRSLQLELYGNPVAKSYLQIAREQMMASAANANPLQLRLSTPSKPLDLPPWDKN
jgi:hypothetical protein